MHPSSSQSQNTESPFFELLAEADALNIRELRTDSLAELTSSVKRSFEELGVVNGPTDQRTFLVRVSSKKVLSAQPNNEQPAASENRNYLIKSADLLLEENDYILARNIYSYLLKNNIRDGEALEGLGHCFLKLGEITSAKKCFQALFEVTRSEHSLVYVAICFSLVGESLSAIEQLKKIKVPDCLPHRHRFQYYKELGNSNTRLGRYDEACLSYQKALELEPGSDAVYLNLGTLEIQRGRSEVARRYFSRTLELNPKSARAHCGLGLACMAQNRLTEAEKEFFATLDLDSQNLVAIYQLLSLADSPESFGKLKTRLTRLLEIDPKNGEGRYALAVTLFKEGNWRSCEKEIENLLKLFPTHSRARELRESLHSTKHLPS